MPRESAGLLGSGIPYVAIGDGPPLVKVEGLTPTSEVPQGWQRRMFLSTVTPLSGDFRVYWVNRKQAMAPGASMSDIAGYLATAIEDDLGGPVFLTGTSTGGSMALQLSVDRPDLVRSLVVVASAYRLGPQGSRIQQELARLTRAGDPAAGFTQMVSAMFPTPVQGPLRPVARLMGRSMAPADSSDLLVTVDAEDLFDVGDQLHQITAPTLVIGGAKDVFYTRDLFEQTAAGVQDGRAHIYPEWGHGRTSTSSTTANLMLGFLLATRRS